MQISKKQAQKYILQQQLLTQKRLKGKAGTLKAIERLGYVQIDTISVVERAHHHILWTRVPNYQKADLEGLISEGAIYDYWAHAAAYLPMRDFRYSLYRKAEYQQGNGHWFEKNPALMGYVLDKFRGEGALMARDFQKESFEKTPAAWAQHPVNQAIRQLFMEGAIMISGRKGFQKIYDLPERVLPSWVDQSMPNRAEYYQYLIRRVIKAQGLIRMSEIGYLLKLDKKFLRSKLQMLVEDKVLVEVSIGKIPHAYFAKREQLEAFLNKRHRAHFHILSPFDNLIIQRKRLTEIFDFDYLLECYVPANKRKFGYFSLPLLYGTDFVGQIDLKTDRKQSKLLIKKLNWIRNYSKKDAVISAFQQKLELFAKFNGANEVITN